MATGGSYVGNRGQLTLWQRVLRLNWVMVLLTALVAGIGFAMLYSVGGATFDPWAKNQMIRFGAGLILLIAIALIDIRFWMAVAYPIWIAGLLSLVAVEFVGAVGMGGQRWLDLGFMRVQPSELMKIAVVLALARYLHGCDYFQMRRLTTLFVPAVLIALPLVLILRQPDLGTSLMLAAGGIVVLFLSGAPRYLFFAGGTLVAAAIPIGWQFLRPYQKERVLTFLDPERDPLGAGYQITQSKIAIGSGGVEGKGFLEGTQSQLDFLPEMKTDFIFTALTEETGLIGALVVLMLYSVLILYGLFVGLGVRSQFGRLLASGLAFTLFLYVLINTGMVMGLLPLVGVPLPLISYGGSAMMTWLIAYGLILNVAVNRGVNIAPKGSGLAW